jgi:anaerobic selenocysteine-containing dehydrogenase
LAEELPEIELKPGQYSLQTLRSHDQFNTTIYNLNDRYRGVYNGRKVVFMNEADIKREGWQAGLWVDIQSCFEGTLREVKHWMVTPFQIAPGTVAVYFPEGNSLIALEHTTAGSNTPISKFVPVTIKQSADQTEGLKQLQRKE